MTEPARPARTLSQHTPRGYEISIALPGFFRSSLIAACVLLALPVFGLLRDGGLDAAWSTLRYVFGIGTLVLAVGLLAVLLYFDRHTRVLYRFEHDRLVRLHRVGAVTVSREAFTPTQITAIEVRDQQQPPGLRLQRIGQPALWLAFDGCEDAEIHTAAAQIEAWRQSPGTAPRAREHQQLPAVLAETVVAFVVARLKTAPALLVVGTALVVVGNAVHLMRAPAETLVEAAPYDSTAVGELLRYRVLIREPNADEKAHNHTDGKAWVEIGVRWQDKSGAAHTNWWRSDGEIDLWSLAEYRLWPLARAIGLPRLEFQLPDVATPAWRNTEGELDWRMIDGMVATDDPLRQAQLDLVRFADQPFANLALMHFARPADWTIAYMRADPAGAMLKRWADGERRASREISWAALIPMLLLGAGVAISTGGLWLFGRHGCLGALIMLGMVLASPWWAAQSVRLPGYLGLEADLATSIIKVFRYAAPLSTRQHETLIPLVQPTPEVAANVLRWTPQKARAAALLEPLGLFDSPLPAEAVIFDGVDDSAALRRATDALLVPVHRRVLAWDDAALVEFLQPLYEGRHGRFNAVLIEMPGCALVAQSGRSDNTRKWIEATLRPDCGPTAP